jgi:hypothetical protein
MMIPINNDAFSKKKTQHRRLWAFRRAGPAARICICREGDRPSISSRSTDV